MKLIRLVGENVRQFKHLGPLHFPQEGLIGILGANGAGKSTLMMIIELAMYGSIKGVVAGDIKHQGCRTNEKWFVELMFEKDGKFYRVYRHENTTKAVLQVNGKTIQIGQQNVTDYLIHSVLYMDQLSFSTCFYARQDDFDTLIKLTDAKRKAEIAKLLRIDSIDRAAKEVRSDRNKLIGEITETKKHMEDADVLVKEKQMAESVMAAKRETRNSMLVTIEFIKGERARLVAEQQEGQVAYEQYNQYLSDYRQIEGNVATLKENSLAKAEARLATLKTQETLFHSLLPARDTYQALLEEKTAMEQDHHSFRRKQQLEHEMEGVKREMAHYDTELSRLTSALEGSDTLVDQITDKEQQLTVCKEELERLLDEHKSLSFEIQQTTKERSERLSTRERFVSLGEETPCPTCERPMGAHVHRRVKELDDEILAYGETLTSLKAKKESIETEGKGKRTVAEALNLELATLREKQQACERFRDTRVLTQTEKGNREERLRSLQSEWEPLKSVVFDEEAFRSLQGRLKEAKEANDRSFSLEATIDQIPSVEADIEQYKGTITILEGNMTTIKEHVKTLNFNVKAYRDLFQRIEQLNQQLSVSEREEQTLAGDIRVAEANVSEYDRRLALHDEKQREIAEKEEEIITLGKLDEVLKHYKDDKLAKLAPTISDIMSDLMDVITHGKYDRFELDTDYNVHLYRRGVKNPLSFYSGGEKKLVAIIQRLAISRLITAQAGQSPFEFVALDEVLGAMDEERQHSIVMTLKNLNSLFKQIFMISHSDHVKDMFDCSMEIYQDDDLCSHIRWVDEWDEEHVKTLSEDIIQLSV